MAADHHRFRHFYALYHQHCFIDGIQLVYYGCRHCEESRCRYLCGLLYPVSWIHHKAIFPKKSVIRTGLRLLLSAAVKRSFQKDFRYQTLFSGSSTIGSQTLLHKNALFDSRYLRHSTPKISYKTSEVYCQPFGSSTIGREDP